MMSMIKIKASIRPNTEICAHQRLLVYRQNALQRLLLTLTVTFMSFVTLFTVYFSSMYSRCDLSTGILYTNIWIWMDMDQ